MRIETSQFLYLTTHRANTTTGVVDETVTGTRTESLRSEPPPPDSVHLSGISAGIDADLGDLQDLDPKQMLALLAIEALLGHKIKLARFSSRAPAGARDTQSAATVQVQHRNELHSESERTGFKAQGVVTTSDGRTIRFSADLIMQREFHSATTTTSAPVTDPLVVDFGGAPAQLTQARIAFDLNSDGASEGVSFVADGSGFLALDRNGDGRVNDGSELFGPRTGNGFAELASYDADQNGWIDDNDPVFSQLCIWTRDGLSTLAEKGVGAIATSSAETPFALKDSANILQAEVRSSGVYLSENGTAGTIQQVDLAEG